MRQASNESGGGRIIHSLNHTFQPLTPLRRKFARLQINGSGAGVVHNGGTHGLAMARPGSIPRPASTGSANGSRTIYVPSRKREEKQSLGTRDPNEASGPCTGACRTRRALANLRSGRGTQRAGGHELVAPAYEWWSTRIAIIQRSENLEIGAFRQALDYHDGSIYTDLPFAEQNRRMDEDGYLDLITMEAFCHEKWTNCSASGAEGRRAEPPEDREGVVRPYSAPA